MLAPSPPPNGLPALPLRFPGSGEELRTSQSEELLSGLTLANEMPRHKGTSAANNKIREPRLSAGRGSSKYVFPTSHRLAGTFDPLAVPAS